MYVYTQAASCILAVGHGGRDTTLPDKGCLTLWSLKDPIRPLVSLSTPAGVAGIAWSKRTPNHIAVGMYSGVIAIYDARHQVAPLPPPAHRLQSILSIQPHWLLTLDWGMSAHDAWMMWADWACRWSADGITAACSMMSGSLYSSI